MKKSKHYDLIKVDHAAKAIRATNASKGPPPMWEYYVDDHVDGKATGWYPYTADGARETENLWISFQANTGMNLRIIESGEVRGAWWCGDVGGRGSCWSSLLPLLLLLLLPC